ncbi:HupE/UreJ family protein [Azospirillum brasilense]|uniref:HupE/UreJ family protein n=1 Tax=Azospirillum brasilense TaxID=192 RepID=UPI000E6A2EF7|nr:HupE/UreJ family protein [Azospirillum brasilense]NUB25130.1 urease accessory protein [Azospirillum brasilense]NUB31367.1 urease accessory protein [Azospirillum brasilense]RIW07823.1 urease accessory protein [Azospirillum brasilense]
MKRFALASVTAAAALAALPNAALAHTFGAHDAGFVHGFMHPVGGWDHLLAMVAVGLWAAQRGGKALWVLPTAFVGAMIGGGLLGLAGIDLPQVELGIVLSVVALGALIALQSRLPLLASAGVVALFAVFHGHAHGAEMPEAAQPLLYGLGFALSTALLHGAGIGAALSLRRFVEDRKGALALRGTGAVVGLAGVALLALG